MSVPVYIKSNKATHTPFLTTTYPAWLTALIEPFHILFITFELFRRPLSSGHRYQDTDGWQKYAQNYVADVLGINITMYKHRVLILPK